MDCLYSRPRHCHRCGGECGFDACTIEHGSIMDGDLAYEYVCGACAKNDDKLKHLFNHKKGKPMKTKESIDEDRLNAFEAFIMFFLTLGMGGVIYLLVRVTMAAAEWLQNVGLWLVLVGLPAAGVILSATALVTCIRWWVQA